MGLHRPWHSSAPNVRSNALKRLHTFRALPTSAASWVYENVTVLHRGHSLKSTFVFDPIRSNVELHAFVPPQ